MEWAGQITVSFQTSDCRGRSWEVEVDVAVAAIETTNGME